MRVRSGMPGAVARAAMLGSQISAGRIQSCRIRRRAVLRRGLLAAGDVTLNKLECSKQALNACIHIHGIGEYVPGSIWLVLRVEGK